MNEQSPQNLEGNKREAAIRIGLLFAELLARRHMGLGLEPPLFNGPEERQRGQN